jgi:hypothetical protein
MKALLLSLLLLSPPIAAAQFDAVPTGDQVRVMLQSSDARSQAWGAWWTAQAMVRNVEPLLQKNLEAHLQGQTWQDDIVIDATLDALIQGRLNPLPLNVLEAVYDRRRAQALILLSRMPTGSQADAFLFKRLRLDEYTPIFRTEWIAVANLLLERKASGFVATLLRGMVIDARLVVCDPGALCSTDRNILSGTLHFGDKVSSQGFPPWTGYFLSPRPESEAVRGTVLASGPTVVTYSRSVAPAGEGRPRPGPEFQSQISYRINGSALRIRYLAGAAPGLQKSLQEDETRMIYWSSNERFVLDAELFRQNILDRYASVVEQLQQRGLLTSAEATELALPFVSLTVKDARSVRSPLPDLP